MIHKNNSRCELLYYVRYSDNPDEMICGALYGCCRGRKSDRAIGMCPYYKGGRDKIANMISEIMPAVN